MTDRQAWIKALKTIRDWSKLVAIGYPDQVGLQIGLLDQYAELCLLSKVLGRNIPKWVGEKI
jgi:hypothetical protein